MPSLKALKTRVKSIKSTQKITKAMQMVAASKLKKARDAASQGAYYAEAMAKLVASVASGAENSTALEPFLGVKGFNAVLIIVFSSDRGLCGAFNGGIIKSLQKRIDDFYEQSKKFKIVFVGKKAYEHFKGKYKEHILDSYVGIVGKDIDYARFQEIAVGILKRVMNGEFNGCEILYNEFQSAIKQVPVLKTLIPLCIDAESQGNDINPGAHSFDPSEDEILERLLPQNFTVQLYNAALVSNTSEHASRMTAMDNATRNSGELIKKLNVIYNRTRQAYITKELIEIISGSEAV